MVYVLDTHPVVWFVEGSPRLSATAQAVMRDSEAEIVIPTMVLVEIGFLYAKKRIGIDVAAVRSKLMTATNCALYPLDEQVVSLVPMSLNIHDAIIVATALVYREILKRPAALVTKDTEIAHSGYVQTIW